MLCLPWCQVIVWFTERVREEGERESKGGGGERVREERERELRRGGRETEREEEERDILKFYSAPVGTIAGYIIEIL